MRWTRFAFFSFGGESFFLKTDTVRPNVKIDYVLDDLSGVAQAETRLELANAQSQSFVEPFELEHGAPYFLTYEKGGFTLNRLNSDYIGWTTESTFTSKPDAARAPGHNRKALTLIG